MQVGTYELTEEWVGLSTLLETEISADDTYYIQNRGSKSGLLGVMLVCEGNAAPTDNEGDVIMPPQRITYQKGTQSDLWLKSDKGLITINVMKGA